MAKIYSVEPGNHEKFISGPMNEKKVDKVPGIGPKTKEKLNRLGIRFAKELYGIYLLLGEHKFLKFIANHQTRKNEGNQKKVLKAMREWDKKFNKVGSNMLFLEFTITVYIFFQAVAS